MREPGIEPGSRPWQGRVMPLNYARVNYTNDCCLVQSILKLYVL